MKLTKSEFKAMIKECMRELIKEGAFGDPTLMAESHTPSSSKTSVGGGRPSPNAQQRSKAPASSRDPILAERAKMEARRIVGADDEINSMMPNQGADSHHTGQIQNPGLQNLVESTARMMAKGNSKLAEEYASIFADTALNTLPKMMANDTERRGYGHLAAAGMQGDQVEKVNEEQLQSLAPTGDMSRWAAVAFGNTGRK